MVGALFPDIDQPTANIWHQFLGGKLAGKAFSAFSGGHRHITHSLLGLFIIGWALQWAARSFIQPIYQPAMHTVWLAFMIGYISHLVADTLTDRGVPWLWPIPLSIKIPPGPEELRVTTGSMVETVLLRGSLMIAAIFLLYSHWNMLVAFFNVKL
jgi:inner membrane protein